MESSRDVEDYLQSMLDLSNSDHRSFVQLLLKRLDHSNDTSSPAKKGPSVTTASKVVATRSTQQESSSKATTVSAKKKPKQINLFSKEGKERETVTLPGRHKYVTVSCC